jgi:hypothetical protein
MLNINKNKIMKKLYIITTILVVTVISTVNVYLAKPNISISSLTLDNIGLAQESGESGGGYNPIPSGGCYQLDTEDFQRQNGYWYKKTVTWSCTTDNVIRYCKVGTEVFHCVGNCSLNLDYVTWSTYSQNISGHVCY